MILKKYFGVAVFVLCAAKALWAGEALIAEATKHFQQGVQAQKEGDFSQAVDFYKKSLLLCAPQDAAEYKKSSINNIGLIYLAQGNLAQAEAAFREALEVDPAYRAAQLNFGLVQDRKADRQLAFDYWVKVFNLDFVRMVEQMKPKDYILDEGPQPESNSLNTGD